MFSAVSATGELGDSLTYAPAPQPEMEPKIVHNPQQMSCAASSPGRPKSDPDFHSWFIENYQEFVAFAIVKARSRSHEDAEEIVDDVIMELWLKTGGIPERDKVFRYIRHRLKDRYRRKRYLCEVALAPEPDEPHAEMWGRLIAAADRFGEGFWSQPLPIDSIDYELLYAAIAGLSETEREAIRLRYFSGLAERSWEEIAHAMGCSKYHAKMHCIRALRHLHTTLKH